MKKVICVTAIALVASTVLAIYGTGWGKQATSTTAIGNVSGFSANSVSVLNEGTNDVFVLSNIATGAFATRMTAGTCIRIPSQATYTFDSGGKDSIANICHATTNASSPITIDAY